MEIVEEEIKNKNFNNMHNIIEELPEIYGELHSGKISI
jgi:hypothetical protein